MSFRASKWPRKFGTQKSRKKIAKMKIVTTKMKVACEPAGRGEWPPISTWINPPTLGSNGIHSAECPYDEETSAEFGPR
jgi:hypothetical protein